MWRAQLNKAVRDVRFVLKQAPEHHGAWRFVETKLPELRWLNQRTHFLQAEISDEFKTPSAIHFVYGDHKCTEDYILTDNLTCEQVEQAIKEKVAFGLTLPRKPLLDFENPDLPFEIVESQKFVKHEDDEF